MGLNTIPEPLDAIRRMRGMTVEEFEVEAARILEQAFGTPRKWTDGGGTGLVQWTGDLGPGLQVVIKEGTHK